MAGIIPTDPGITQPDLRVTAIAAREIMAASKGTIAARKWDQTGIPATADAWVTIPETATASKGRIRGMETAPQLEPVPEIIQTEDHPQPVPETTDPAGWKPPVPVGIGPEEWKPPDREIPIPGEKFGPITPETETGNSTETEIKTRGER